MVEKVVLPNHLPVKINKGFEFEDEMVLAVVTATKPDFYKQAPLLPAADKAKVRTIIIHAGQHYDELLGHGMKEFKLEERVAFNLQIRGDLLQKSYELVAKMGFVSRYLQKKFPKTRFVPIVHGDTLVTGMAPIGWMFGRGEKGAQNEAGLRGMAPKTFSKDSAEYINNQWYGDWIMARQEPFPEQWDTFTAGASSEFQFAPVELNKKHLLNEGNPEDRIFVVGNSVVDAVDAKSKKGSSQTSVFDDYPELENGEWIRMDIHRRLNLTENRFKAVVQGTFDLVESGEKIVWIELPGTKFALESFGLREKVIKLSKAKSNFLFTPLWKEYSHVMEFLTSGHCLSELTDSGSMQEELNHLGVPCMTVRYNTDRPETVMQAKTNLLVPAYSAKFFSETVGHIKKEGMLEQMKKGPKLYGSNVAEKIIAVFKQLYAEGELTPMRSVPDALGFGKDSSVTWL
ncbi:MAG: UDP-N-acetyl glucosamine 2-epimerase [Candidatus Altiarchaeota archaeon]|nr:UDP-N-acetyl glucosamine 2-epimerase [Candidatus Altiarchaeota archaeon]